MDFRDDGNPYLSPVIVAEVVEPKRPKKVPSIGFRVVRAFLIAVGIFMAAWCAFYWYVQSVISSRP